MYYSLNHKPILPIEISKEKGVYVVYALNSDLVPQSINRILAIDKNGILYIGQTTKQNFKVRIEMLRRVMNHENNTTAHSGGLNYKHIKQLRKRFPISSLYVSLHPSSSPRIDEEIRIEKYRQKFGEVPPLNGSK